MFRISVCSKRLLGLMLAVATIFSIVATCGASSDVSPKPEPEKPQEIAEDEVIDLLALYTGDARPLSEEDQSLYDHTVMVLLKQELWTERDMYDTCHYLMIPMHYAFRTGNEAAIQAFADFFAAFTADVTSGDPHGFQAYHVLQKLQFLYLTTQFMCLCAANDRAALIPGALPSLARNCAENYLLHTTANWNTEPTVIEHLRQILAGKEYPYHYYSCTEDLDGFTLAILCDLNYLAKLAGETPDETLAIAEDLVYEMYSSPLLIQETERGGWLLQPGVWSDHPDLAYAGNETIYEGIQLAIREDVAWDSSHFTRWPLYLRSYESAQSTQERRELFAHRREQLANQMANYVLKNVNGQWLLTTFMDGTNGVYRYSYSTEGVGLEGYALSGTFLLGWWAMLEDERITAVYEDILKSFPMEGDRSNPYFDYATTREQNPFFDMDTAFDNGMFECMVMCATKIFLP